MAGVGLGDERPVGLGRDRQVAPEMGQRDLVGLVAAAPGRTPSHSSSSSAVAEAERAADHSGP